MEEFVSHWLTFSPPVFTYSSFLGYRAPVPLALALGTSFLYVLLVFVVAPMLTPSTKEGKAFCERIRFIHNVALFLFSLICCGSVFVYMFASGEFSSLQAVLCTDPPRWIMVLNLLFTFSKLYEWGDTFFLVWLSPRGANSFLHLYHHATTFWLFLLVSDLPGPLRCGLLLNGGVHTLMYAHYAWGFPKAVVPLITVAQISQLATVTYLWSITPSECPRFADFPTKWSLEFVTPYLMVPVYLIFFIHFFFKRFILSGDAAAGRKKK